MKEKIISQIVRLPDTEPSSAQQGVHPGDETASKVLATNHSQSPTHSSTGLAERRPRPPALVPSLDGRRIEISPAFLHSLFAVDPRPKWHPVDDQKTQHEIAATFSTTLLYRGSRPDQDAGTVLFGLIRREIGQEIGRAFTLPLRPFAKASAWSDSSSSNRRCLRALHTLAEGRARYIWNGEDDVEIGFIRIHEETATHAVISFDPSFAWAFTGFQTFLDFERRTLLQSALETWLYGIAMSNSCRNAFAMHRLHHLSGSTKLLRQFGTEAIDAMATLVRFGFIRDCHLDQTPIRLARPELFSNDLKASDTPRTSQARRDPVTYLKIVKRAQSTPDDACSEKKTPLKPARRIAVRNEPEQPEFGFDHEPYSSHEYDDIAPDIDDLPCGDDDE